MAFLGFFVGLLVIRRDVVERGYDVRFAYDLVLWAYVGGWIGARLFVIPTGWTYFVEDPIAFLLSSSGWVWYGGLIGGTVAVLWWARSRAACRRSWRATSWRRRSPSVSAIGRIGCQLAGDGDYGVPTDLPWGMSYPDGVVPTTERVHPTPLYELVAVRGDLRRPLAPARPRPAARASARTVSGLLGRGALRRRVRAPQPGLAAGPHDGAVVLDREHRGGIVSDAACSRAERQRERSRGMRSGSDLSQRELWSSALTHAAAFAAPHRSSCA